MVVLGKWEKVRATIVESPDAPAGATEATWGQARVYHEYLVEVLGPKGQALRAIVGMVGLFIHAVGEPMAVEVNFKSGEVRLDRQGMAEILRTLTPSMRTPAWLKEQEQADAVADGGRASAEDRLAELSQLHDKGLLTEAEYQAKREQIISEI